ncbi:hypothetical protein [Nitrospina watsonii]|uniref:Uncharacterized protein n=1 Tax=Nitrospina watsonii TaxID=1323948 RepID=A0ABN8W142_9BACT|nr:hypothetical protein [Nitrospina watsonii]CAI2719737.1 conserved protein of unknown function [Nitrospina watsonii]
MPTQTPRLNLTQPDTGSTSWSADVASWADKLDEAAAQTLCVHLAGAAIDEEVVFDGFRFEAAVAITKLSLFARQAPEGAAFSVDVLKNGAEQSKVASLSAGLQNAATAIAALSFSTLEDFGLKVKSVGSTVAGSEITLVVHYQPQPLP